MNKLFPALAAILAVSGAAVSQAIPSSFPRVMDARQP